METILLALVVLAIVAMACIPFIRGFRSGLAGSGSPTNGGPDTETSQRETAWIVLEGMRQLEGNTSSDVSSAAADASRTGTGFDAETSPGAGGALGGGGGDAF